MVWVVALESILLVAVLIYGIERQNAAIQNTIDTMRGIFDKGAIETSRATQILSTVTLDADRHRHDETMHRLDLEDRERQRQEGIIRERETREHAEYMGRLAAPPIPTPMERAEEVMRQFLVEPEIDPSPGLDDLDRWDAAGYQGVAGGTGESFGESMQGAFDIAAPREDIVVVPPGGSLIPEGQ